MAATLTHLNELSPQAIARKTKAEAWFQSIWGQFIGSIVNDPDRKPAGINAAWNLPTSPITKYTEFVSDSVDTVYVPQFKRLYDSGVYGDLDLEGNEESLSVYRHPVYVNALAHAVKVRIGPMNDLRGKKIAMMQEARPALRRWFSDKLTWEVTQAFYKGYSPNTTATAITGGLAVTGREHPNFYVADGGWATWNATAGTYAATIDALLDTLDAAATDARAFSADLLDTLRPELVKRRITMDASAIGNKTVKWVVIVHPDTMAQARADTRITEATEAAFMGKMLESPILNGTQLYYNGFAIIEDLIAAPEVHASGDVIQYGPVSSGVTAINPLRYYQSSSAGDRNMKMSLILGSNAMSVGELGNLEMVPKVSDYKRKETVGATLIAGMARNDSYDNIASPTDVDNFGSAVIATNSPALT